jgi:hypothetical protein
MTITIRFAAAALLWMFLSAATVAELATLRPTIAIAAGSSSPAV